jgi:hypothetical protein
MDRPYTYTRRGGFTVDGISLVKFLDGQATRRRRGTRPTPSPTVAAEALDAFESQVKLTARRIDHPVTYRSRGRTFSFYWHRLGERLLVRVRPSSVHKLAEALARKLQDARACARCGVEFPKRGRAKFCSDECKVKFHTNRRSHRRRERARTVKMLIAAERLQAQTLENAKAAQRRHRSAQRRQQRARLKLAASVDQRDGTYRAAGGTD